MYRITHTSQHINRNTIITPDGFSSIYFYNQTDANITIDDVIVAPGLSLIYRNRPDQHITSPFLISFLTPPTTGTVIVRREYNQ